jgi:hypothetical protein
MVVISDYASVTTDVKGKHASVHFKDGKRKYLRVVVKLPMVEGGDQIEVDIVAMGWKIFCKRKKVPIKSDEEYRNDVRAFILAAAKPNQE